MDILAWVLLGKPCQYILQTLASRELSLLCNGLPTYSNNDCNDDAGSQEAGAGGGDLCGLYSALSQGSKLVVEDIPQVGGVISCQFGPVWGYHRTGPQ